MKGFVSLATKYIYDKLFEKFGVTFSLVKGNDETKFSCIFQPLRYKNKIYLSGIPTELGYDSLSKYLILAPAAIPVDTADGVNTYLSFEEHKYCVDHCEKVYFKKSPAYYWAIVHREDNL